MELLGVIKDRKSYRSFSIEKPDNEEIELIFEAARIAASSSNAQGWKYYYAIKGSEGFNRILNSLAEGNQSWAKNAAILAVSCAAKFYDNGKEYSHSWHDVGLANAQLILQATHLGYFGHMMGGFSSEKAALAIEIDNNFEPVCVIAIGKKGDGSDLSESFKARENQNRVRKPLEEVAKDIS
jgi:nitroreductase